jgi:glycosyltransferase involved in cell wall biosynthesis
MSKNLLMVAWGLSPRWGSEEAMGWHWLANVPPGWSTTLLTARRGAEQVQWGQQNNLIASSLCAIETPKKAWRLRTQKMGFGMRMELWWAYWRDMRFMQSHAKSLIKIGNFDLIHQTTIATWRCGMPFHSLGLPTVWGPIGGSEPFPWRYLFETSPLNWFYEAGRSLTSLLARKKSEILNSIKEVDVVISTNRQTEQLLRSLGRIKPILRQPMVMSIERFQEIQHARRNKDQKCLKIIGAGTIEGRKGFALTIKALAKLKNKGIPFEYTIAGNGFELEKLKSLVKNLDLEKQVFFPGGLDSEAYIQKLNESHVFCFPSLRDNSPLSLLEAMAAGCVPIVLDNGGPAEAVDSKCGFVLPLECPRLTIDRIQSVLSSIWSNQSLLNGLSRNAIKNVEARFLANRIPDVMAKAYSLALENFRM